MLTQQKDKWAWPAKGSFESGFAGLSADAIIVSVSTADETIENLLAKEWLLTNERGSYACSTIIGCNTRRYPTNLKLITVFNSISQYNNKCNWKVFVTQGVELKKIMSKS